MSDVVLLNPNSAGSLYAGGVCYAPPPLDLCWTASALESGGFSVRILDLNLDSGANVAEYLARENSRVVGVAAPSPALPVAYSLLKLVRQNAPEAEAVLLGQHVSGDPGIIIDAGVRYGLSGCCGRGFTDLCRYIIRGEGSLQDADGLIRNVGGSVMANPAHPSHPDALPFPARHLLDIARYRYVTIATSLGCPYKCLHCGSTGPFYVRCRDYLLREPELVVRELREAVESCNARVFDFVDDVFTHDEGHVRELCRLLVKERLGIKWSCSTRPDLITEELLTCMKKAGCMQVCIGVESGSEAIRRRLHRDIPDGVIRKSFRLCRKMGVRTRASALIGLPGESRGDVEDTIEFIRDLRPTHVFLYPAVLLPASGIYKLALEEGIVSDDAWVSYMKGNSPLPVYVPDGMTRMEISLLLDAGYKRFYSNPRYMLQRIGDARSVSDLMEYAGFMHFFSEHNKMR
jgi:radical SAM superfamily enzyme YgiQ (UPF0313 family)